MMRRSRRGHYAILLLLTLLSLLAVSALAIDASYAILAKSEAQSIADAAAESALRRLLRTGNQAEAIAAAELVCAANRVAGEPADLLDIRFGRWRPDPQGGPSFRSSGRPTAVRVRVGRTGNRTISWLFGGLWGIEGFGTHASATATSGVSQLIVVLEISDEWTEAFMLWVRQALIEMLEVTESIAGADGSIALITHNANFAWEYTPITRFSEGGTAIADQWSRLHLVSRAGVNDDTEDGVDCAPHKGNRRTDYDDPPGGCYPEMPRKYHDETGADLSGGLLLTHWMLSELNRPDEDHVILMINAGGPFTVPASSGNWRASSGYVEERWREFVSEVAISLPHVRAQTLAAARALHEDFHADLWTVSLRNHDDLLLEVPQGDGRYLLSDDPFILPEIIPEILASQDVYLVE